jgi:hypothetical protein
VSITWEFIDKQRRPGRLWSLWDMLTLDARKFVEVFNTLVEQGLLCRNATGAMHAERKKSIERGITETITRLQALDLPVSIKIAENVVSGCNTFEELNRGIEQLLNSIVSELEGRKFYGPIRDYQKYHDKSQLFGPDVFNNFPSANDDIFEAGMCLAFERGTSSVMHLMRVVEVGLGALAKAVQVNKQNDWGGYLREIDKELTARMKISGARSTEEQFYAEAAASIDNMRRAWRNPTMHPDRTYSHERAEEILLSVNSFMSHLATRLAE